MDQHGFVIHRWDNHARGFNFLRNSSRECLVLSVEADESVEEC